MTPRELATGWRERAEQLDRYAPTVAAAFRDCADQLDVALRSADEEVLTLAAAAAESGFSADHLRHEITANRIPNAGKKGRPRVLRRDLPRKAKRATGSATLSAYDPASDALSLVSRTTRRTP